MIDHDKYSRRSLIAAAIGAVAATVAQAVGRPSVTLGADGDNVLLGRVNHSIRTTQVKNDMKPALWGATRSSVGVLGTSVSGVGVTGRSTIRDGVIGTSEGGTGVSGYALNGVGVFAGTSQGTALVAQAEPGYFAIEAHGNIRFDSSNVARIQPGEVSVAAYPNLPIMAGSFVLLTAHQNLQGRDLWYTTDSDANTITIKISSPMAHPVLVSWLLLS